MGSSPTPSQLSEQAPCTLPLCLQSLWLRKRKRKLLCMTVRVILHLLLRLGLRTVITHMRRVIGNRRAGRRGNRTGQPGRTLTAYNSKEAEARPLVFHPDLHMVSSSINDSYCLNRVSNQLLTQNFFTDQTMNNSLSSNVKYHVVQYVPSAPGLPQRKGLSPGVSDCHQTKSQLKSVKGASCVTQLLFANPVSNAPNAVPNLPVGARLQKFWESWLNLGLKLTRSPTVISCYVNPQRNSCLLEALHQLIDKNAVEQVMNKTSLSFFNRLFLVPKPNNKWRPILDLNHLNPFLKT